MKDIVAYIIIAALVTVIATSLFNNTHCAPAYASIWSQLAVGECD